jgi:aspartate racemase
MFWSSPMATGCSGNTHEKKAREIWGVIGGLGPVASAEFMKSIYETAGEQREQELPVVYLLSDPSYPDRTEMLQDGRQDLLLDRLTDSLSKLGSLEVTRVVICCVTIHVLLDQLPSTMRAKIVSLTDVVLSRVLASSCSHLLVCTQGTRRRKVFESHPLWQRVRDQIVIPDDDDQEALHSMIYAIKMNRQEGAHAALLDHLLRKYAVDSFIAGCTELHVLIKGLRQAQKRVKCIDPLQMIAEAMSAKFPLPENYFTLKR